MESLYFSIIIPTFNRADFIRNSIESVLNQNFKSFEILVIDDGSTDDTKNVVKSFLKADSRVSYYYQKNSERAVARNNGANKSKGKFLIFLDSDDYFSSLDHLRNLYDYISNTNFTEGLYFTGAKIKLGERELLTREYNIDKLKGIDFFVNESIIPARVCLSRSIFNELQFDEDCIVVEDTVLWTAIKDKYPIYYIPIYSVTYLLHDDNSVNIKKSNAYLKRLKGLKKLFYHYDVGKRIPLRTKQYQLNRCYFGIAEFYFLNNKFSYSKFWILVSIFRYPHIELKHKLKMLILR